MISIYKRLTYRYNVNIDKVMNEKKGSNQMKLNRPILVISISFLLILLLTACKKEEIITGLKEADVTAYTTIYPIQFVLEQIGGDTVSVESVFPPGVDAHTYEPTSKDMTAIATSDLFIYLGPSLEGFVESAAKTLADEQVELVSLEDYPELFQIEENDELDDKNVHRNREQHGHSHNGGIDPHFWIDPKRMITLTEIIADLLIEHNPKDEQLYKQNKNDLITRLQKLDRLYIDTLSKKEHKYLVVPHKAYGYWEDRYGIEQIAISGLSPSEEPSQKYLSEIIKLAKEYELDYVFYEQNTPDKLIEIIREEINADVLTIHNLSVLTEADLENEEDYFTLMEYNLNVLNEAFY